jgi:hypothetical protein
MSAIALHLASSLLALVMVWPTIRCHAKYAPPYPDHIQLSDTDTEGFVKQEIYNIFIGADDRQTERLELARKEGVLKIFCSFQALKLILILLLAVAAEV